MTRFLGLAACALSLVFGGCLKVKDETRLGDKGAGTLVQTFEVDLATTKHLTEIARLWLGSSGPAAEGSTGPAEDLFPDLFSAEATQGLAKGVDGFTLRSHEDVVSGGKRVVTVKADFKTLEAAARAGRFLTSAVELGKNADGSYTLSFEHQGVATFVDPSRPGAGKPAIPGLPEGTDLSMVLGMLEPYLSSLKVDRTLALPGAVVETNGTKSEDGKSVTFSAGYADLLTKSVLHKVTFRGDGLDLQPFRVRPDPNDLWRRAREGLQAKAEREKAKEGATPAPPPSPPPAPPPAPAPGPAMEG